jgi:hypothetical protein
VGAVALVLAGAVATPVEARTRQQAARTTRADGVMCADTNGHHIVTDTGSSFYMACLYDDGTMLDWELPYDGE